MATTLERLASIADPTNPKPILFYLLCFWRGHFYRPTCEWTYKAKNKKSRQYSDQKFRYTCICCGRKTEWMTEEQEKKFVNRNHPTWGAFGSDSQGTRRDLLTQPARGQRE